MVWTLAIWTVAHAAIGAIAQLYALARSLAGRTTPTHDADVRNVTLYHHFLMFTAAVAWPTLGLFPEVA
jgi:cytochrome c oxidase subunit I+III